MMCGEVKLSYENIHVKETSGFVLLFTKNVAQQTLKLQLCSQRTNIY